MRYFLFLTVLTLNLPLLASGTITIDGYIGKKTPDTYVIQSGADAYKIKSSGLTSSQVKILNALKFKEVVKLDIPMDAIVEIRSSK